MHVVIATKDRLDLLERTLRSIAAAARPSSFRSVIVVENGGRGTAAPICAANRSIIPIDYHCLPRPGKARAVQFALEAIGQGPAIFLDDDVRVNPSFFTTYAEAMLQHGRRNVYGGRVLIDYETAPPPFWLLPHLPPSAKGFDGREGKYFLGANFGVFAEDALAVGGFDVELGTGSQPDAGLDMIGEETDLQKRLYAREFGRVYLNDAKVWHWVPEERCTPGWAVERQARHAATAAWHRVTNTSAPTLWGAPRWMWRELAIAVWTRLRTALSRDLEVRFEGAVKLAAARAQMRAAKLRLRGPS